MTSLNTCLRSKPQAQAGGANGAVTKGRRLDIDLHTPISIAIQPPVEIDLPLEI